MIRNYSNRGALEHKQLAKCRRGDRDSIPKLDRHSSGARASRVAVDPLRFHAASAPKTEREDRKLIILLTFG